MDFDFKKFFLGLYNKAFDEDIFNASAQVAFYFSFAIFPLVLFLVTLFGFFLDAADNFRADLFFYLAQIMPRSASKLVQTTIEEITENSTSGKLTLGILIALWSASAGMDSLRIALNSVFKFKESRAWWRTKLLSIMLTFLLTLLITIALGIVFYGWQFVSFLFAMTGVPVVSPYLLVMLEWIITLLVLLIIFDILFNVLPDRKPSKWHWITPGTIVGIVLWLLVSNGFRIYLSYFNTYDRFYGSIGAVIILMLWLYLTALAILVGGTINSVLREMNEAKALETETKQLGDITVEDEKFDKVIESET